jgi:hypothetical protein
VVVEEEEEEESEKEDSVAKRPLRGGERAS